jgi:DNA-binding transcriptional regulator LsrR (DeoR family)
LSLIQLVSEVKIHSGSLVSTQRIIEPVRTKCGGLVLSLPVPAFFDNPEIKQTLWKEFSASRVSQIQSSWAVFRTISCARAQIEIWESTLR